MAKLSPDTIRSHAANAGFKGDDLNIAVAVALAESSGDPRAHNATPPDNSYGLWQINMLGAMGPSRRKSFGLKSNDDLYDPATNAKAAYSIFRGSGWKAWTTYTRGTYKKHMGTVGSDTGNPEIVEFDGTTSATPAQGTGIVGAVNAFGGTIFKGFANVAAILVAIALLGIGIILLVRKQAVGVLPVGKVGKAVLRS